MAKINMGSDEIDHRLFSFGPVVVFRWVNAEGWPVEHVTSNVAEVFGCKDEAFLSGRKAFADFIHPDDLARVAEEARRYTESGAERFQHEDYRIVDKSGKVRWLMDQTVIERDGEGRATHFVGYVVDITRRKEAELAALASENKYKEIIALTSEGFWAIDPETKKTVEVNEAFCKMLGYAEEDLMGRTPVDLADEPGEAIFRAQLSLIPKTKYRSYEVTLRHKSGSPVHVKINGTTINHADGSPMLAVAFVTDISSMIARERQLISALAELERSYEEWKEISRIASHDLQEPVRMVTCYTDMLRRKCGGKLGAEADEAIDFAVSGAKRMAMMVRDLRNYSDIGTSDRPFATVNLSDAISRAMGNLGDRMEGAQVTVDADCTLSGDIKQLETLFECLIGNAIKYRHPDRIPHIDITLEMGRGQCTVSVADNGIGIKSEYFDNIFQVFRRLHSWDAYPGTGIGLAICRKIAERHGGHIGVESTEGVGSTFRVTLRCNNGSSNRGKTR